MMTSLRMLTLMKIVEARLVVRPMIEMVVAIFMVLVMVMLKKRNIVLVMFMILVLDVLMKMMAKMEGG